MKLYFLGHGQFHAAPEQNEAVEGGGLVGALYGHGLGIAGNLADGLLAGLGHFSIGGPARQVFQLEDVAVSHIGIDTETGLQIDVGVAANFDYRILTIDFRLLTIDYRLRACVKFTDRQVEVSKTGLRQGEAVDVCLTFLLVTLGGETRGRGVAAYPQVAEEAVEAVGLAQVVVLAQHVHQQRLTEATRANEEEVFVAGFYLLDEAGLIYIVEIVEAHVLPILLPVGR